MEPDNPLLDDYILSLAKRPRPRGLFVPTASGDAETYVLRFYQAFASRAEPSWLPLFRRAAPDLDTVVREADIIYVGGGSTPNLLACWRMHGLDLALHAACEAGVIVCGLSAGAMCWFEHPGITDSLGPGFHPLPGGGVGLVPGSFCPHYDGQAERRDIYPQLVASGELPEGWAAEDSVAIRFDDGAFVEAVSSREHARAWRVTRAGEEPLAVRYLRPE
jgi:peptidase E